MPFLVKVLISALLIATISEVSKRSPGFGALIASLPLVSILAVVWLWRDTHDPALVASHLQSTFWLVLPSLPMFLIVPFLLRAGHGFWPSLLAGILTTAILYAALLFAAKRLSLTI
jgi:hypothetical protein